MESMKIKKNRKSSSDGSKLDKFHHLFQNICFSCFELLSFYKTFYLLLIFFLFVSLLLFLFDPTFLSVKRFFKDFFEDIIFKLTL